MEIQDAHHQCKLVAYAPHVFMSMLNHDGIALEEFKQSFDIQQLLAGSRESQSEGKSGSFFVFTPDKRFILKTVPMQEACLLVSILPNMLRHFRDHPRSLLARVYGVYALQSAYAPVIWVILMSNIFAARDIHQRFDIKGSWVSRRVGEAFQQDPSRVLGLDQDFVEMHQSIKVGPKQKQRYLKIIFHDTMVCFAFITHQFSILLIIIFILVFEGTRNN
jgi:1-phosphatidylinositol-4-phosphate 5-kinase